MSDIVAQMSRINAILENIPDSLVAPIRETAMTQAALIAAEIKANAPVDPTAQTPGALKESVRLEELPPKGTKLFRIAVKAGGKTTQKAIKRGKAGSAYSYDYARATEFGTQEEPAHPFFFPIWRARRKEVRAAVRAAMKQAIKGIKF